MLSPTTACTGQQAAPPTSSTLLAIEITWDATPAAAWPASCAAHAAAGCLCAAACGGRAPRPPSLHRGCGSGNGKERRLAVRTGRKMPHRKRIIRCKLPSALRARLHPQLAQQRHRPTHPAPRPPPRCWPRCIAAACRRRRDWHAAVGAAGRRKGMGAEINKAGWWQRRRQLQPEAACATHGSLL